MEKDLWTNQIIWIIVNLVSINGNIEINNRPGYKKNWNKGQISAEWTENIQNWKFEVRILIKWIKINDFYLLNG